MAAERILIVDDNVVNLKLMRVLLAGEGYDVRTATDADEALSVVKEFSPRLVLMDIQLPGMDGLALTRRLKADPAFRDMRSAPRPACRARRIPPSATCGSWR